MDKNKYGPNRENSLNSSIDIKKKKMHCFKFTNHIKNELNSTN